jgi:hypothetical protein
MEQTMIDNRRIGHRAAAEYERKQRERRIVERLGKKGLGVRD